MRAFPFLLIIGLLLVGIYVSTEFKKDPIITEQAIEATQIIAPVADTILIEPLERLKDKKLPERDAVAVKRPRNLFYRTLTKQQFETDTFNAPVYSKDCLKAANRERCTQDAIDDYLYQFKQEKWPELEWTKGDTVFVRFMIDQYGVVNGPIELAQPVSCSECVEFAMEAVVKMPKWYPAYQLNQPVKIAVVLPVAEPLSPLSYLHN